MDRAHEQPRLNRNSVCSQNVLFCSAVKAEAGPQRLSYTTTRARERPALPSVLAPSMNMKPKQTILELNTRAAICPIGADHH
ncbi:unnamed protein product [Periconia digitata]|uniref:Uncharacterized protein n=1 Tax=Periconia digitata TaxID=1303443 RepID=A0A9W4UM96_9PLEO|nr:unnamed protein product [Periconia digitata]